MTTTTTTETKKQTYKQMKNAISENYSKFPIKWAFSGSQLEDAMRELKVNSTSELLKVACGGLIRKTDLDAYKKMLADNQKMREDFLNASYENFFDAILYELHNHEYGYSYDAEPALNALGLDESELNEMQLKAFNEATKSKYHD